MQSQIKSFSSCALSYDWRVQQKNAACAGLDLQSVETKHPVFHRDLFAKVTG